MKKIYRNNATKLNAFLNAFEENIMSVTGNGYKDACVRFDALMAIIVRVFFIWNATPCSLVELYLKV
jgi:hypothetical protein